jgi:hypothetical protein
MRSLTLSHHRKNKDYHDTASHQTIGQFGVAHGTFKMISLSFSLFTFLIVILILKVIAQRHHVPSQRDWGFEKLEDFERVL